MDIELIELCKTMIFGVLQIVYLVLHYLNMQELVLLLHFY